MSPFLPLSFFAPKDILGFLGRKWERRFNGDVQTEVKTDRVLGTRIKHRMTRNWLKMYDKFGRIPRVETVINRPRKFSIHRTRFHRDGTSSQGFYPVTHKPCRPAASPLRPLTANASSSHIPHGGKGAPRTDPAKQPKSARKPPSGCD